MTDATHGLAGTFGRPRIARVFPRKTKASPRDELAFFDVPGLFPPEVDEVHVSVTFTWDIPKAERLARAWEKVAPVKIGGPAFGGKSGEFHPGMYLRKGYVITSRGCPNHCWFCSAWKREGITREYPIVNGHNVLDDNLLACSYGHINAVFDMLSRQKERVQFTGGLEAARLESWMVKRIRDLHPWQLFFAYDTADDWDPLVRASKLCWEAGWTPQAHTVRAYVLIGYPGDSIENAHGRLKDTARLGIIPCAMLWRDEAKDAHSDDWKQFARFYKRPAITSQIIGGIYNA
jgi:hypothetical protein